MADKNKWVLWENEEMSLRAAFNPAIPRQEGFHLVLLQKAGCDHPSDPLHFADPILYEHERIPREMAPSPWANPALYSRMQEVAAKASGVIIEIGLADWINIHCDGNIGAAKGKSVMHIHIFARLRTGSLWGGPLQFSSGEGPYGNEPLTEREIEYLKSAMASRL